MSQSYCPELKLEILLWYKEEDLKLTTFASSVFVSIVTLRKWIQGFEKQGYKGLCTKKEWEKRCKALKNKGCKLYKEFECCNEHVFSKSAIAYLENLSTNDFINTILD